MKKRTKRQTKVAKADTMRPEYDFSTAVRGVTATRYAEGANVAVIDPDVLDVFRHSGARRELWLQFFGSSVEPLPGRGT